MSNYNINFNNNRNTNINHIPGAGVAQTRTLFASVFTWMFVALGITTLCAVLFSSSPSMAALVSVQDEFGRERPTILGWVCVFSPLVLVLVMNFGFNRLSFVALMSIFFLFSALFGISLSSVFLTYDIGTIGTVFASTCALFGVMALVGYTTKTDLTKTGNILRIGLIGIIIASLINMFMRSGMMDYIISIIGVAIFTGLAAYNTQKIKDLSLQNNGSADFKKLGVMGALTLYLNFINLFLMLLRVFGGNRRD